MRRTPSRMRALLAAAAVMAGGLAQSALGQNLFSNPSFETGDFTGWTPTAGSSYTGQAVAADASPLTVAGRTAEANARTGGFTHVSNAQGRSSFSQTISVTPGTTYEIGGWASHGKAGFGGTIPERLILDVGDASNRVMNVWDVPYGTSPSDFVRFRRLYTAGAGQTSATFTFTRDQGSWPLSFDDFFALPFTPAAAPSQHGHTVARSGHVVGDATIGGIEAAAMGGEQQISAAAVITSAGGAGGFEMALLRVNGADDGAKTFAVRTGQAVPEGNGTFYTFRHVSATGEYTAFLSGLRDNPSTTGDGVYRWSAAAGVANVARLGQAAPDNGGTFNRFDHTHVTSSGGVAFEGQSRSGSNSYRGIYYKPADGPLRRLMRGGLDGLDGYAAWTINDAGQAAILATAPIVQYRILFHDGNALSTIAQGGIYSPPALNNSGDIAYSTNAIFLRSGASGTIARVVGEHDAAPGGGTIGYVSAPAINDAGQIAFHARLSDDRSGIYRTDAAGNTVLIARSDQAAPEGGGALGELTPVRGYKPNSFNSSHWAMPPAIAPGGQVAFMAYSADGIDAEAGIYLGDPSEVLFLTRWGHTLDGGVVTDFKLPPSNSFSFPSAKPLTVNEQGQIAMTVQLADGQTTTQLFTPTLHWRSATSGTWSDSANWTVGLAPAEVHPVIIDSPHGVIVTTPAGETKIKSLEVGVGNKLTLTTGSDLIVSSGGFVNIAGALAGSGTITGNVTNAGVIAPGNSAGAITIDGDYLQSGRLDLELLDGGFDQLIVTGDAILGGDVFVLGSAAVGDTFSFFTADNIIDNATWHLPGESTMQIVSLPSGQQGVQMTNVPETAGMRVA